MKNRFVALKRGMAAALAAVLAVTALPATMPESAAEKAEATDVTLKNPRIVADKSMEAKQKVSWDCVYFGSYPQAEVIPSGVEYTALDAKLRRDGDVIVSDSVYSALQSASGWNDNNDITLNGVKYRRMKQEDATFASPNTCGCYDWSNSTDYHYFKYEPIKWRVLRTDGNQALLLSDVALDDQKYHTERESVTWETSTVRSWLNGYGSGSNKQSVDYSQKNFIGSAFTVSEQAAIVNSFLENADNIEDGTSGGNATTDKVFLLSESDVWNTDTAKAHGFVKDRSAYICDEARRCMGSTYAKAMGMDVNTYAEALALAVGNGEWWLRSPGHSHSSSPAMDVDYYGRVDSNGSWSGSPYHAIRQGLYLNLASPYLYTYAGTVCSDGTDAEVGGGSEKPDLENPSIGSKLTYKSKKAVYKVTGKDTTEYLKTSNKKTVSVKIPDKVTLNGNTYKVTSVGTGAFQDCKKLKSVVVGKNVTSIGSKAFSGCKALKKITIKSAKLKKVGKNAFKGIHAKAVIKAPKAKLKAYKKLLKKKGQGKKVRITK